MGTRKQTYDARGKFLSEYLLEILFFENHRDIASHSAAVPHMNYWRLSEPLHRGGSSSLSAGCPASQIGPSITCDLRA